MPRTTKTGFTQLKVEKKLKHKEGPSPSYYWDSGAPGLGLKITAVGNRSYIFQKRLGGKVIRMIIGNIGDWTLSKAREEARRLARTVDRGIDPRKERRAQKAAEEREGILLKDVWTAYLDAHKSRWTDRHYSDHLWHAREPNPEKEGDAGGVIWPLLQMKLVDIDAGALVKWASDAVLVHEAKLKAAEKAREEIAKADEKERKEKAKSQITRRKRRKKDNKAPKIKDSNIRGQNSALRQGFLKSRALWRWAYQRDEYSPGMADPSIFAHDDFRALLPKSKPKSDVLEKGQLAVWFEAVLGIENKIIASYLQMLLLTGARRNELGDLKWGDVDFKWKAIWLKDKVEGEAGRKIPLTPYVKHLLDRLPRPSADDRKKNPAVNDWVFYSVAAKNGRMVEPRLAHRRALAVAGLPSDLSLHGLRRSFSTLSEWLEIPTGIVAQIMGHRPSATAEKHYKRRSLELLAGWHEKLEKWLLKQAKVNFNPETVDGKLKAVKAEETV